MWHIHCEDNEFLFTDSELLKRHKKACEYEDCEGHDPNADDQVEAARDCLNQMAMENGDDLGVVATDDTCEVCLADRDMTDYIEQVEIPLDDDGAMESALFPSTDVDFGD
jgi:hypothetical protein